MTPNLPSGLEGFPTSFSGILAFYAFWSGWVLVTLIGLWQSKRKGYSILMAFIFWVEIVARMYWFPNAFFRALDRPELVGIWIDLFLVAFPWLIVFFQIRREPKLKAERATNFIGRE